MRLIEPKLSEMSLMVGPLSLSGPSGLIVTLNSVFMVFSATYDPTYPLTGLKLVHI